MHTQTPTQPILTEREISAFITRPLSFVEKALPFARPAVAAVLAVGILFGAYSYLGRIPADRSVSAAENTPVLPTATPEAPAAPVAEVIVPAATPEPTATPVPLTPDNTLVYSSFNISAPVVWDTPVSSKDVDHALANGVIHLAGTPKPGEDGYTAIFGHSSSLPWVKGDYKDIFAPILKAKVGQEVLVTYENTTYRYIVDKVYEIQPDDFSVIQKTTGPKGAYFITCSPIGTSLRRTVLSAHQI